MSTIGIKELRTGIDAALRRVTDDGETIQIVSEGQIVAQLAPVDPPVSITPTADHDADAEDDATWAELMRLGEEISKHWPKGVSAVDAIRDQRRF